MIRMGECDERAATGRNQVSEFSTTRLGDRVAFDHRGSGPALVFVAGAGAQRATDPWTTATAVSAAERGITTIVYDRLGRGESPASGRIDLACELAALETLIDVAGGSAVLCGHSSGCTISLAAAVAGLPVTGLVLWEAPIGNIVGGAGPWAAEVDRRIEAGDLEGALAHYMKDMPPEWLEGARSSPAYAEIVSQVVSYRADGESLAWAESAPLAEVLGGIRVPVKVMAGSVSFDGILAAADAITAAIPGATQQRMPGENHMWEPEPMARELAAFVTASAAVARSAPAPATPAA
jgi:pimeloyl-ACP methyl ester carboxylesterase